MPPGLPTSSDQTDAFKVVRYENEANQGFHTRFWWNHGGHILGILLTKASFSVEEQFAQLNFFEKVIAPCLGPARDLSSSSTLSSFLTDDGIPLQFSWEWAQGTSPLISYTMEPNGAADFFITPGMIKQKVADEFYEKLKPMLPASSYEWFNHFNNYFQQDRDELEDVSLRGHHSRIFYTFKLCANVFNASVYFFPRGIGRVAVYDVKRCIETAPRCRQSNLGAFLQFYQFISNPYFHQASPINIEMVRIGLGKSTSSTIEIYIRSPYTDFTSVIRNMSLDGKINLDAKGIRDLEKLWSQVLHVKNGRFQSLPHNSHRTAGVMYSFRFELGDEFPHVKVYIPVEHYGWCDQNVMSGVATYLAANEKGGKVSFGPHYEAALTSIL